MMSDDPPIDDLVIDVLSDDEALLEILRRLQAEHRVLDEEITALIENGAIDMLNLRRMKKQKLILKDRISALEDMLTPDIIA